MTAEVGRGRGRGRAPGPEPVSGPWASAWARVGGRGRAPGSVGVEVGGERRVRRGLWLHEGEERVWGFGGWGGL